MKIILTYRKKFTEKEIEEWYWFDNYYKNSLQIKEQILRIGNQYKNYNEIIEDCGGEGYEHSIKRDYLRDGMLFRVKLFPIEGEYSFYLKVYKRD